MYSCLQVYHGLGSVCVGVGVEEGGEERGGWGGGEGVMLYMVVSVCVFISIRV